MLKPFDSKWIDEFENEKSVLLKHFGDKIISIHHIGSTCIRTIMSKPIIDILVVVKSITDILESQEWREPLRFLHYTYRPQETLDRIFFVKGSEENRTHHLSIVEENSREHLDTLLFRNYLKKNRKRAFQYNNLKIKLAKKYSKQRAMYTKNKAEFIETTLKLARNEKQK